MSKNAFKGKEKKYTILPYISRATIYVLISLVIFLPLFIFGLNQSVGIVHSVQKGLTITYNDINVDNSYTNRTKDDYVQDLKVGKLIGTVTCKTTGLNEKVYYGINRVSLRNGLGFNESSYLFGEGECSKIAGYSVSSVKSLYNVHEGDVVKVDTYWGTFTYQVKETVVARSVSEPDGDSLIIATSKNTDAFSIQSDERFYVIATLIDKEVR